jgi:hypothetical protein
VERLLASAMSPENGPLFIALGIIAVFLVLKTARRSYLAVPWVRRYRL